MLSFVTKLASIVMLNSCEIVRLCQGIKANHLMHVICDDLDFDTSVDILKCQMAVICVSCNKYCYEYYQQA
jgi:hypothetical protein